ncbi:MAG TPA: matrixin family metalloprotease [Gemmatimonadaceae bacterium]
MKRLDLQRHFHPRPSRARRALLLALAAAVALPALSPRAAAWPFGHVVTEGSAGGALAAGDIRERKRDIKRRLRQAESFTYIDEILVARDSALTRWRDRTRRPLKVWIQPGAEIPDFQPDFPEEVRQAFRDWEATGIPVRFDFVDDAGAADVHVTWLDRFDEPISGKTRWARDSDWWIVEANIAIAIHHNGNEALDHSAIRAISLHEVGHLLGLDHTGDVLNIMTPRVRARALSAADSATVVLLYSLPPGDVR